MLKTEFKNRNAYIYGLENFEPAHTLDCGQAFRWSENGNGRWCGVAYNRYLELSKGPDGTVVLYGTTEEDFENIWYGYFDLKRDYASVIRSIEGNEILARAAEFGKGIRILNQEPWETLCSFIISQNNNIKRIKGIIARLCESFGESRGNYYTFPSAERLAALSLEDLSVLRAGFRAKYISDAAKKVAYGEIDLSQLQNMPVDEAREILMKIKGVGPKVADCALLFSHGHTEAFPKDVWIKRALQKLFDGELPSEAVPYAGIVQQYIFFYARETRLEL